MNTVNPAILQKIGTTTPMTISPSVASLCRELSPDFQPRLVPVRSEREAKISECFYNVLDKVRRDGGSIVYGWVIWQWLRVFVEAEHHAVWDDGTGLLTDVTPKADGERRIMFLPDPARAYDFVSKRRIINVKRSLGEVAAAQHWIDATDKLARFITKHSNGALVQFDPRDIIFLALEVDRTKADVLVSLAMSTSPNDPCVCGGRQRFRKCCAPFISLKSV